MVVYFGMKDESANYSTKHCENASGLPRIVLVSVFKVVLTLEEMQSRFMRLIPGLMGLPYGVIEFVLVLALEMQAHWPTKSTLSINHPFTLVLR